MQYIISFAKFPLSKLKFEKKTNATAEVRKLKKKYLLSHINEVLIYPTAEKLRRKKNNKNQNL
jgi:hypothetical protein